MRNDKSDACGPENQGIDGPIGPEINKDEIWSISLPSNLSMGLVSIYMMEILFDDLLMGYIATISMKYSL